ncbi:MAG: class I SAM-dependent methyltransferase [bacterium]|nr:class I SAM-dependent methyltransferase [bacterium]
MSPRERRPEALVLDPGVLREGPVCEFGSALAVEARGGTVITPWRDRFRAAEAAELNAASDARDLSTATFPQVVVHLQKSRAATFEDLAQAWRILSPGGQLLLTGTNRLGIVSAVKRLAAQLDQSGIVVSNRARARAVRFKRDDGPGPETEMTPPFEARIDAIDGARHEFTVETRPGVFSAKKLDAGSEMLLDALARFVGYKPPKRVLDLGCGTGVLGLAAAMLYPDAEFLLADADARAVECARANIERLGFVDRMRAQWWDAREKPLDTRFDLALVNPPFHYRGPDVDLGPALAIFDSLPGWLGRKGRALLVANRTLPYETPLERVGVLDTLQSARGYKLLSLKRSARSSGSGDRHASGSRSSGSSRALKRSR